MKKYIFLTAGFFLFSGQSLLAAAGAGGAGSSTFLDGYDPQVTGQTVFSYCAPFSTHFIGKREATDSPVVLGVGGASWILTIIKKGTIDEARAPRLQEELDKSKAVLAAPKGNFEVEIDGVAERRSWRSHLVSELDIKIAEALYKLVLVHEKQEIERYDQVESAVWAALRGILDIPEDLTHASPKKVAAMDLWSLLMGMKLRVYPYDPPVERLSTPPYASGAVPNDNVDFLAERFNTFVTAYQNAKA